jgi:hypothetical protein
MTGEVVRLFDMTREDVLLLAVPDDVAFPLEMVFASSPDDDGALAMANASAVTVRRLGFQASVAPRVVAGNRISNSYVVTITPAEG